MRDKGQQCWGDAFAFLLLLSNRLNCLLDLTCIIKIWVVFEFVIIQVQPLSELPDCLVVAKVLFLLDIFDELLKCRCPCPTAYISFQIRFKPVETMLQGNRLQKDDASAIADRSLFILLVPRKDRSICVRIMKIVGRYILKCHCLWGGFYFKTLGREVDEGVLSRDEHKRTTLLLSVLSELLECCEELSLLHIKPSVSTASQVSSEQHKILEAEMDATQLLVCFHIISVYELYDAHLAVWLKQHGAWHAQLTEIGTRKIYARFIALLM